jgi:hypothetical protein
VEIQSSIVSVSETENLKADSKSTDTDIWGSGGSPSSAENPEVLTLLGGGEGANITYE